MSKGCFSWSRCSWIKCSFSCYSIQWWVVWNYRSINKLNIKPGTFCEKYCGFKDKENELPKWTENQVTQSSRDIKNFGPIVKDFRISVRKMREFHMKQDCFSSTYFMFRSLIKGALIRDISIDNLVSVLFSYNVLHSPPPPPRFVKGGPGIQIAHVKGGREVSEVLVVGTKRGSCFVIVLWCFVIVQQGSLLRLVRFFLTSCKNNLSILVWGHLQNVDSGTIAMTWLTIMRSAFFIFSYFL